MIVYTAIQPSGTITLGNYIGSLKNFDALLENCDQAYLNVADLHSITIAIDPQELRNNVKRLLTLFFALDYHKKATIFVQSHVPSHCELTWILLTLSKMGELERMTQYKDKSQKQINCNVGLFTYPVLMASDILLYNTTHVPVGIDQKQHLELAKELANRFNSMYQKDVFVIPQAQIKKQGSKIYSLTDPSKKMSKSDENPKSYITLWDDANTICKKIKSATTDSVGIINYDPEKQPGVSNLLVIYAELENISMEETLDIFKDQNYGFLKEKVSECIINHLTPIQAKMNYYENNFHEIENYLQEKLKDIKKISDQKINEVYQVMGLK